MNNNITLNTSMRNNLLSLRNISKQMDKTQLILATGKKVNSAIDNASAYYQARSLTNRAADLTALLDAMEQGIQTIEAATQGLTSGAEFLEQASAVVNEAMTVAVPEKEWFEAQDGVAAVVSNWQELKAAVNSGVKGDIVIYGNIKCEEAFTLKDGQNLVGVGFYGVRDSDTDKFSQLNFDLAATDDTYAINTAGDGITIADLSIKSVMSKKSSVLDFTSTENHKLHNVDLFMDVSNLENYQYNYSQARGIYRGSNISISGKNYIYDGELLQNKKVMTFGLSETSINLYGELNICVNQQYGRGISISTIKTYGNSKLNISSFDRAIESCNSHFNDDSLISLYARNDVVIYGNSNFNDNCKVNFLGKNIFTSSGETYKCYVYINSSDAFLNFKGTNLFYNGKGNYINLSSKINSKISFNGKQYKSNKDIVNSSVNANNLPDGFVSTSYVVTEVVNAQWLNEFNKNRSFSYEGNRLLINKKKEYDRILYEYDLLIKDSSYQGINLLKGGNLEVTFNESRSNKYSIAGVLADSMSLGLETRDLEDVSSVKKSLEEITKAVNSIRSFQEELGNHYSIIQTRINFTEALTDVLETGADNLTLADMNEASAEYLTLQTRQQLAINSLSLASQSASSILSLF